ncbi:MAG: sensor histidine kinase [Solirubrobacterales bacterium]|nr:sensor histidine kinase [Solirubrobacterales bacterium]
MIRGVVGRGAARTATVVDWLPVLALPPVLVIDAAISSAGKPITVLSLLAAIVACLPLVIRRRVSFPALAPLLVAGIVLVLWQLHPANTVVLIPMVALFELAVGGDRRRSVWIGLATVPCVFISVLPFATASNLASIVIRNLALCLLAIAAGDVLRSRRLASQRMVAAREQETLRRVGEERLRIAREIHDLVAHAMTAINVQAGVAAHLLERDPTQAYGALRSIKHTSGEALSELRATLDVLRDPSQAAPLGPAAGLEAVAELTDGLRSVGVAVELEIEPVADVPTSVQSAGYRIIQEALTNVARHARASHAQVAVRRVPGALSIEVTDDGRASRAPDTLQIGNGLRGMRERATALGGTLEAAPSDSGGWRVRAVLPVAQPAQETRS